MTPQVVHGTADNIPNGSPLWLYQAIADRRAAVLARHGAAAFTLPRAAAVAHEAGHAIVYAHEGFAVREVVITRVDADRWVGGCQEDVAWHLGPTASGAAMLARARAVVAGYAGEAVADVTRPGAAMDEIGVSQMLTTAAAKRLGHADAHALWSAQVWQATVAILRRNSGPFNRLAALLAARECVNGGQLRRVLRTVEREP